MEHTQQKPAVAQPPKGYDEITKLPVTDRGAWVATSRGGMWSIKDPHPRDVFIDDLVWGTARQCRYGGQIRPDLEIYSVAEHACTMTWWAIDNERIEYLEDALAILLHDASEAFYGDIATPIKELIPEYRMIEDKAQAVITHAFGLTPQNTLITKAELKEIDKRIRVDERMQIIAEPALSAGLNVAWEKEPDLEALGVQVDCMLPSQARAAFLNCFTWCCENLPARDSSILPKLRDQLDNMAESFPGERPTLHEIAEDPFPA
jgi:5'-deoxynucleotidase YfbR-like HD superfamily hydrolase